MTIVLQHQFWDLNVTDHGFEVGLSFSGVPERLLVPFDALTGFFDPSVQFGLKFEISEEEADAPDAPAAAPSRAVRGAASEPSETPVKKPALPARSPTAKPAARPEAGKADKTRAGAAPADEAVAKGETPNGAEVVSLDAFRKKN
jgi:hypothetical protein